MASDLRGYTEQETLNKVLNTDNDSIQVDIVDATGVTITTSNDSVYADDADWTDSTSKHTLVGGLYQSTPQSITDGDVGPFQVDADGALHISDGGNAITVDGTVTANLSATDNAVLDAMVVDLAAIEVDLAAMEVLLTAANVDHAANEALLTTIDADTGAIKTAVETIDNAISGTEMQVDVVASLPAGSAAIGKLAANSGVDIGDVDVTSIVPGTGATNLGKAEDAAHSSGDTGVMALVVRNDVLDALAGSDGDYSALQVNKTGALNVTETVGHLGAHYESSTTANSSLKIVAFQFLEDTKFSVLTPATSAYIGNTGGGGDDVANTEVFPQGMTIFGRWTAFTLVSGGRVIAYLGDW